MVGEEVYNVVDGEGDGGNEGEALMVRVRRSATATV